MLLWYPKQIFTQLHIADEHLLNDTYTRDESVLRVGCCNLVCVVAQHRHRQPKLASHLILHCIELRCSNRKVLLSLILTIFVISYLRSCLRRCSIIYSRHSLTHLLRPSHAIKVRGSASVLVVLYARSILVVSISIKAFDCVCAV